MKERIMEDLKTAMKEQNKEKLAVIRMVKGAITLEEINKKEELNDLEVIDIIQKQIKTRNESIENFKKGNRDDLVIQTEKEIEILNEYLPEPLTQEEVLKIINEIMNEVKPTSMRDMGTIISKAKEKLMGRADIGEISKIIKEKLSNL